ncbi:MAG TPA: nickel-responsive transcriptional regulator NikR [Chthoniobacterales bacterium]|nr:nickel-responsive transcriptional regulator NikR [Chthoniobacterales bacterium]
MAKEEVARFGVSLHPSLLRDLDRMARKKGFQGRSLAISEMIRDQLVEDYNDLEDSEVIGTVTLVYDHHRPQVQRALTNVQHKHLHTIISTLHVHLDHNNCLEVLEVRGRSSLVKNVADHLIATKGVKHGKLTLTTTGKELPR